MNQVEKDEILQQVGSILHFCHEIVSRLSSSSPPPVQYPVKIPEVNNNFNFDDSSSTDDVKEADCHNDDLWWWDSHTPSHFYNLVYEDDDVSLFSFDTDYAKEMSKEFIDAKEMSKEFIDAKELSEKFIDDQEKSEELTDDFQEDLLFIISISCPHGRYDPNWKMKALRKLIDPQLVFAWDNAFTIFDDDPCDDDQTQYQPPVITYHTIDLQNVNARFIENIPKPTYFPIHGVSPDPDFYHKWYPSAEPYKRDLKFLKPNPFGGAYGYQTNIGIVPPPTDPIHGYIWTEQYGGTFVLHAVKPGEGRSTNPRRRRG